MSDYGEETGYDFEVASALVLAKIQKQKSIKKAARLLIIIPEMGG